MTETEITVDGPAGALVGTFLRPEGRVAGLVIFLHGTGPMDRDENMPGQALNVFNAIAERLAAAGWASFRYDKRGCGASGGDYLSTGHFDLVADARAVVAAMRSRGNQRIVLVGHSEGTLIAAELAAEVDGLVLLAPFVSPMRQILLAQAGRLQDEVNAAPGIMGGLTRRLVALFGGMVAIQRRLLAKLDRTEAPVIRYMGRKVAAKSLREMLALDLAAIYRAVRVPVLAVSGGKDIQCPPEDGPRIAEMTGGEAVLVPDMTHLLRLTDSAPGFADYARQLALPVDPAMIGQVIGWLGRQWPKAGEADGEREKT